MQIHNARMVLGDSVVHGSLSCESGVITSLEATGAKATASDSIDFDNDYLLPGLVELHTDNLERHVIPRPQVFWPNLLAAAVTHDAEVAASGITTVFDSVRVGAYHGEDSPRRELLKPLVDAIERGTDLGAFRVRHRLHLRCELTDPQLMELLASVSGASRLSLVSLMDHTPGQRQWRDLDALRRFASRDQKSAEHIDEVIEKRIEVGHRYVGDNRQAVLRHLASHQLALASHDDTTTDHIDESVRDGIGIAEFPCSLEAAKAASAHGMKTVAGAPNLVRGGSHSGNVSVMELATHDVLHALSSDYVPASLLQAVWQLVAEAQWSLPRAVQLVTEQPARMANLNDRGRLDVGCLADFVQVAEIESTPIVRSVYVAGSRVS